VSDRRAPYQHRRPSSDSFSAGASAGLLAIVETLYKVEQPRSEWIAGVRQIATTLFAQGVGSVFYDTSSAAIHFEEIEGHGVSDALLNEGRENHANPNYVAPMNRMYRSKLCATQHEYVQGPHRRKYLREVAGMGARDALVINGRDASGQRAGVRWRRSHRSVEPTK
jgi:hypothetical protein